MAYTCPPAGWEPAGEDSVGTCGLPSSVISNKTLHDCQAGHKVDYADPPSADLTLPYVCPFNITSYADWEIGLKITLYVIAMAVAAVGNLAVLLTIIFSSRLQTSTSFYLAQLAVADLFVSVFNMWVHLGMSVSVDWPFSGVVCRIFPFFQILALTASVLCLTAIAADRFFVIVYPLRSRVSSNVIRVVAMVTIWVVAVLVAVPNLLVRELMELKWADRHQKWCEERWPRYLTGDYDDDLGMCSVDLPARRLYYTLQVVAMYCLPIVAMVFAYSMIGYRLTRRMIPGDQPRNMLDGQMRTRKKAMRMLAVVFMAFVVCWTPQEVLVLYDVYHPKAASKIPRGIRFAAIYLAYLNSSINPLLYAWLGENFRKGFRDLLHNIGWKKRRILPVYSKVSTKSVSALSSTTASRTPSYEKKHCSVLAAPPCEKCLTGSERLHHSSACSQSGVPLKLTT